VADCEAARAEFVAALALVPAEADAAAQTAATVPCRPVAIPVKLSRGFRPFCPQLVFRVHVCMTARNWVFWPRVIFDCHFRKTGTEYDRKSGRKWLGCTEK
jgi:hypothetical protein